MLKILAMAAGLVLVLVLSSAQTRSTAGAAVRAGSVVVRGAAEQVGHGPGRRRRRRFARQRLGLPSSRDDSRRREGRVAESAASRVLHPGAVGPGVRAERQVRAGLGRAWPRIRMVHDRAWDLRGRPGQRLAERQREGRQPHPEVHEHGQVRDADRPRRQEQGQQRHRESRRTCRPVRLSEDQRAVRRRRLLQPSRHRLRRDDRRLQAALGRVRQAAGRRLQVPRRARS